MAGSMARLLTCEKCFSYSGSCFLAGWLLDTSCSFWIYFIKDIEHYIRLECFIKGQRPLSSRVPPRVPTGLRLEPLTLPVDCLSLMNITVAFYDCIKSLAIFGVNCLNKTQPQIGDFRLKNGKLSKVFISNLLTIEKPTASTTICSSPITADTNAVNILKQRQQWFITRNNSYHSWHNAVYTLRQRQQWFITATTSSTSSTLSTTLPPESKNRRRWTRLGQTDGCPTRSWI